MIFIPISFVFYSSTPSDAELTTAIKNLAEAVRPKWAVGACANDALVIIATEQKKVSNKKLRRHFGTLLMRFSENRAGDGWDGRAAEFFHPRLSRFKMFRTLTP